MISEENEKVLSKTTYAEYLACTRRLVRTLAPTVCSNLDKEIFRTAGGIESICYAVIKADMDFNGNGSRYGFRKSRALYAMKSYSTYMHIKRYRKFPKLSLNFSTDGSRFLYSTLSTLVGSPEDVLLKKEELELLAQDIQNLPQFSQQCVQLYYYDKLSLKEIGIKLAKSHEWIRQTLKDATTTIRKANEKKERINAEAT